MVVLSNIFYAYPSSVIWVAYNVVANSFNSLTFNWGICKNNFYNIFVTA